LPGPQLAPSANWGPGPSEIAALRHTFPNAWYVDGANP
jgi:hypothetical protein